MKRGVVVTVVASAAMAGLVLAWSTVRRDREFRRLIAQGDASLATDQTFVAIENFSGAIALKPDSMLAHLKRGETYRKRNELTTALRDLRAATSLDPSATRPREALGDVNVAMGRYERAVEEYRSYLAIDERSPRVLYKLALTYFRNGQPAQAIEPLRQALAFDPRSAEAHYLLGMCLRPTRPADAARSLARAVELKPSFAAAREELADVLSGMGKTREAFEQLDALATLEPARPERAVAIGLAYARLGRTDAAVLKLGRAAEQYPEEPMVYVALGRVWLEIAEAHHDHVALAKAIGALQGPATAANASSESLALYGHALLLSGDLDGAARSLEQATTRLPVDPLTFLRLSTADARLGRLAGARDALISYVTLAPDDDRGDYATEIADLSLRLNDAPTAVTWARRAIQGPSSDIVPLGLLAEALWRIGKRDEGRQMLTQALQHDPRNRTLLRLKQRFAVS